MQFMHNKCQQTGNNAFMKYGTSITWFYIFVHIIHTVNITVIGKINLSQVQKETEKYHLAQVLL